MPPVKVVAGDGVGGVVGSQELHMFFCFALRPPVPARQSLKP